MDHRIGKAPLKRPVVWVAHASDVNGLIKVRKFTEFDSKARPPAHDAKNNKQTAAGSSSISEKTQDPEIEAAQSE
jgi:hypothetical protein